MYLYDAAIRMNLASVLVLDENGSDIRFSSSRVTVGNDMHDPVRKEKLMSRIMFLFPE